MSKTHAFSYAIDSKLKLQITKYQQKDLVFDISRETINYLIQVELIRFWAKKGDGIQTPLRRVSVFYLIKRKVRCKR